MEGSSREQHLPVSPRQLTTPRAAPTGSGSDRRGRGPPPRPVPWRTSGKRTNSDSDLIRIRLSHHRAGPGPPDPIAHHRRAGPARTQSLPHPLCARAVLLIEEEMRTHSAILPVPGAESSAAMRLPAGTGRVECWTRAFSVRVLENFDR